MGDEAKLASSGLILAIGGGSIMPWLQGKIIDWFNDTFLAVRISFVLPLICFIVIAYFGYWVKNKEHKIIN
jgi:FHS family L-fucose permease-like MFS transporter